METGIIGLKQSGKSTIFNILTGNFSEHTFGKKEKRVGTATVFDERIKFLSEMYKPKKTTYAKIEYVDMPGVEPGDLKESFFTSGLRNVDALMNVIQSFETDMITHPSGSIDIKRDIENLELELIFSDLFQIEKRIERIEKDLKKIKNKDLEREYDLLNKLKETLSEEKPLRTIDISPEDEKLIRGYTFLSLKPILHVINLNENEIEKAKNPTEYFNLEGTVGKNSRIVAMCAEIEEEIAQLPEEDKKLFLEDLGIEEAAKDKLIHENYKLLGLISFFTVGEDEVKAWTIKNGTIAKKAAGQIHSDIEKGFIRAEVVKFDDFYKHKSMAKIKELGLMKLEGKEYLVEDGDIINFRFNI